MALGKVDTISADPTIGTIIEDETSQVYGYNDPNFPNTGLKVGDPCTYDIDYTTRTPIASNLMPYVPSERVITGPLSGPVTVNVGESLIVKNGGVITGSVVINNGNMFVQGTGQVNGDVTVNQEGSLIAKNGGVITGSVVINSGSALKVKTGGMVRGNIDISKANRIIVGDPNGGANSGGTINGAMTIDKIRKVTITSTSKIN